MRKHKGIMALEEHEEIALTMPAESLDEAVNENQLLVSEVEKENDQVEEAISISASVDNISERITPSIDSGEGITENEAALVNIAVENFCTRLGYSKKVVPSMEGFGEDKCASLKNSKIALENIKELQEKLGCQLAISQENFFSNALDTLGKLFATDKGIEKALHAAHDNFKKNGPNGKAFTGPSWSRAFSRLTDGENESEVDIVRRLHNLTDAQESVIAHLSKELIKAFEDAEKLVDKMVVNIDAEKELTLFRVAKYSVTVNKEISRYVEYFDGKLSNIDLPALDKSSEEKLYSAISNVVGSKTLHETYKRIAQLNIKTSMRMQATTGEHKLLGMQHWSRFKEEASKHLLLLIRCFAFYQKLSHSSLKYIENSTN